MPIKEFIQKSSKKKDKKYAQVALDADIYERVERLLKTNKLKWQQVLHAGLEQFLAEYERK
jgi:hypothetical protein